MTGSDTPARRRLTYFAEVSVGNVRGIGNVAVKKLRTQGIESVADLLLTVPRRYLDRSQIFDIGAAPIGEEVTIGGTVASYSKRRISRGRTMIEARVFDGTRSVRVVWFNPWIRLKEGEEVALSGKLETFKNSLQMKSPDVDRLSGGGATLTGRILPIYGSLGGLSAYQSRTSVDNAVNRSLPIVDIVPDEVRRQYGLVSTNTAVHDIHLPDTQDVVAAAMRRLIFDEFLRIQMAFRVRAYDEFESRVGITNDVPGTMRDRFLKSFPFELTGRVSEGGVGESPKGSQMSALDDIVKDMRDVQPMHRLLQGEVGSGKTVVVIAALLSSVESGHQGTVMAPTEVLATQHYLGTREALIRAGMAPVEVDVGASGTGSLFGEQPDSVRPIRIGLFTSGRVTVNFVQGDVSREQGLAWLVDGTIDIAIGTHALIQPDVRFASLGMTVVDEQHRFGVEQRVMLRDAAPDEAVPDLLLMTATPIPRTLAMTLYGDLDVSVITEMPVGRQPVATSEISGADDPIDEAIAEAVKRGNQVFVVCPLVENSDKIEARSAVSEFRRVEAALPNVAVGLLHGKMRSQEKAEIMGRLASGEIDVLVSTTVIEVGIDIPNATLMIIRDADRFGLSQLHQLRGRVGRGDDRASCFLVSDDPGEDGQRRIDAMVASNDGFELANADLEIRGQGTVFAGSQSGAADLKLGDILRDRELLEAARAVATSAVDLDRDGEFVTDVMAEVDVFIGRDTEWLSRS
jgi:ATP-dependent DNA helicase RecG